MRPQLIMFLGLIFTAGTLISLILGGLWFGSSDVETINSLTVMRPFDLGIFTAQVPNLAYFSTGLAKLTTFDFAFFEGGYGLIQWLLIMTIGAATAWVVFTVIITIGSTLLGRR